MLGMRTRFERFPILGEHPLTPGMSTTPMGVSPSSISLSLPNDDILASPRRITGDVDAPYVHNEIARFPDLSRFERGSRPTFVEARTEAFPNSRCPPHEGRSGDDEDRIFSEEAHNRFDVAPTHCLRPLTAERSQLVMDGSVPVVVTPAVRRHAS